MNRHAPWIFLMLSFFSCFRKKTPPETLEAWLDLQFPGRFEVQVSNLKMLDIIAQYKSEKRAVVVDKSDPEVQFFLDWQKGAKELGLDTQTVALACERAKSEVAVARRWQGQLLGKGLEQFSVGAVDKSLIVQVFGEPSAALRKRFLDIVKAADDGSTGPSPEIFFLEIMEPAAVGTEYNSIIPHGHWEAGTGWQKDNLILSLRLEPGSDSAPLWEINPESKRSMQHQQYAFRQAKAWAAMHLAKPFFMEDDHLVGIDLKPAGIRRGNAPAIGYSFPFFDKAPSEGAEPAGYVSGIYYPDEQVFDSVRKHREF